MKYRPKSFPAQYAHTLKKRIVDSTYILSISVHSLLDVSMGLDSNIPLVAQELMKKMIHQFALEYASKSLPHTHTNGITTRASSPLSDMSDTPLDLTLSRNQEKEREPPPGRENSKHLVNSDLAIKCSIYPEN